MEEGKEKLVSAEQRKIVRIFDSSRYTKEQRRISGQQCVIPQGDIVFPLVF